jgi:LAO/AO transport system kinase
MLTQLLNGDRRALARLLTAIENEDAAASDALTALFSHTGRAHIIGVTGAPGTGKSTLVSALTRALRARGRTVAVLAVDPSSPFTGGALLGDRVRMRDLAGDPGVFIRSMASRGSLGGLARTTRDMARALDAAGFDIILIETVGAGQGEIEIARLAQTVLVVDAPGLGDDIQAIKAGILEIADVLVVNKADRPGADQTARALRMMLELGHAASRGRIRADFPFGGGADGAVVSDWTPPIVQTVALEGRGIDAAVEALDAHRAYLRSDGHGAQIERRQLALELLHRLRDGLFQRLLNQLSMEQLEAVVDQVQSRAIDPYTAVNRMLAQASTAVDHPER